GLDELALPRKLHYAGTVVLVRGMSISDKNVAIARNGNAGWPVKRIRPIAGYAFLSDRHQYFARRTQLQDLLTHQYAVRVRGGDAAGRCGVVCGGCAQGPLSV